MHNHDTLFNEGQSLSVCGENIRKFWIPLADANVKYGKGWKGSLESRTRQFQNILRYAQFQNVK